MIAELKGQQKLYHKTRSEVIKLEFILKLKIKCNDWLLVDTCQQSANFALNFEFETVLKFHNLGPRT